MAHYVHDEKNNRIEALSKEETYALLAAAIQQGQLPSVDEDTAFVTMFKSIVDGKTYKMGFCTQAQYNQLEAGGLLETDAYYIITDDTSYNDLLIEIENLIEEIETNNVIDKISTIDNATISVVAGTTIPRCSIFALTSKRVVARAGAIVVVECDMTVTLTMTSSTAVSGTASGSVTLTMPAGFRPAIAIPLTTSLDGQPIGDLTNYHISTSKLSTNGNCNITFEGDYSSTTSAETTFNIRTYGTYTTL